MGFTLPSTGVRSFLPTPSEKNEASKGPFDFDDLQGVWFLAESSAKARSVKFGETSGMYYEMITLG